MVRTKWVSEQHNIGMTTWNEAWLLTSPYPTKLITEVYRGPLVFRLPGTSKRIGYLALKKHLRKKAVDITEEPLPF
ncbi:MAG: hypothetical protein ICV66_01675 [Chitinophagaceae bacterium]|nr:hypothetical protein [Chitinophagaceae bacterium]